MEERKVTLSLLLYFHRVHRIVQKTADGSPTLFIPELNETYHSRHGAITESMYVFIKNGLHWFPNSPLRILEIGLGTGLNALLTCKHSSGRSLYYTALEPFPLEEKEWMALDYGPEDKEIYHKIHGSPMGIPVALRPGFEFQKWNMRVQEATLSGPYHLVYFDAFAPSRQPDIWETGVFERLGRIAGAGAMLTTYSASGIARRNMQQAGWEVKKIPGPPGKKEMVRAFYRG